MKTKIKTQKKQAVQQRQATLGAQGQLVKMGWACDCWAEVLVDLGIPQSLIESEFGCLVVDGQEGTV